MKHFIRHSDCDSWRGVNVVAALITVVSFFAFGSPVHAQTNDLTVDVLVNSTNTTGYNTNAGSPGEYQRYPERYLEHLQIPYRVIDVSNTPPPASLSAVPLIIAGHRGLNLTSAWQQAISSAVQAGTGFVNLDWDPAICTNSHMQAMFGCASSIVGTAGTSITIPAVYLPDGSTPHYITALQLRWPIGNPASASGDLVYLFHQDDSGAQGAATSTVLLNAQGDPISTGTVLAKIGNDPMLTVVNYGSGHAVHFGTYDYLRADRFGFVTGLDDLFWRSLVWAARKPFVLRGYPRYFANQQDDPVDGWSARVVDMFNPALTGNATTQTLNDGSTITIGGPWKVQGNIQTDDADFNNGTQARQNVINFIASGNLRISPHTSTGGSGGDLFWTGQSASQLTDSQWLANYNALQTFQQGGGPNGSFNGGNDALTFSSHVIPHFWDFSNNIGADLWNSGFRYITEIQQPGVYYSQTPAKTPSQRMPGLHPFRVYEQPPTNGNPNEIWSIYWADDYTIGSRAGLPAKTFFGFTTQLQGLQYPSFDAKWPVAANGIPFGTALENWQAYTWRFWSSMAPVEIYNHDGGSMADSTDQERQQLISTLSPWLAARGVQYVYLDDLGAYLHARVKSTLTSGTVTPSTISLTLTGSATDMNGTPVSTYAYVFYQDDNGQLVRVPGFTNGTTISFPNVTPPAIGASPSSLSFAAAPGGSNPPSQTISISNIGAGTLNWSVSSTQSWLHATPGSGTNSGNVTVSINISGLAAGTYSGAVTITAPNATNAPVSVPVNLAVAPPTLSVNPSNMNFSAFQGQGNPASQTLSILNSGSGTVNWSASSNANWLTLSSASGTAPSAVTVSVNTSGLALGVYQGTITVTSSGSNGSPATIPVTLTLKGILLSDNFNPATMAGLAISPLGLAANWSVSPGALQYNGQGATQLYAGNAAWTDYDYQVTFRLSSTADYPGGIRGRLNPSTGASYAVWLYPNEKTIKLFRNVAWSIDAGVTLLAQAPANLDTTTHTVDLVFQGTSIKVLFDGSQIISTTDSGIANGLVGLDVSSRPITFSSLLVTGTTAPSSALMPSPSTLTFSANFQGPSPAAQTLNLSASGGALAWTAAVNAPWLQISPASGATNLGVQVTANSQGLAGGTYNGTIVFTSLGATNSPLTVNVTLNVTLPPPTLALSPQNMAFMAVSGQAAPPAQSLTISNAGSGAISWNASSDASWLTVSSANGNTPSQVSVSVSTTGLALGSYVGHITVSAAGVANSPQVLTVNLRNLAQVLNENFSDNAAGWVISPLGHANGWSVTNNTYNYGGLGESQSCAGNGNWGDYIFSANIRFSSLANFPGGLRARVNPGTGAGYALWFYPGSNLVKLFSTGQWNIDNGATLIGQAPLSFDTTNFHTAKIDMQGSQINVYWDGTLLFGVTDATYTAGNICLEGSSQPISYQNVSVLATQAAVTLAASPSSLSFAASSSGNPANQTISLSASGGAATDWTVTSNANWLSATAPSTTTPATITVSVSSSGLAPGTYSGALTIAAPGATNSPLNIPVTLSVQSGAIAGSPTSLLFFGAVGFNPAAQKVSISSQGGSQVSWAASAPANWDSLSPLSGTTPGTLTISPQVASTSLAAGTYNDTISITSSQAPNTVSVPVTLNVGTLLFNDNFSGGAGNWTVSPLGSPSNWTVSNSTYDYNGAGTSNSSVGNQSWTNYNYSVDFKLASLNDFPGGIRGRVNLTTGAGYGAWIYPNEKVIKLYRIGQWNIDAGFALLATSNVINIDATTLHNLKLDLRGSTISVYYDNVLVASATDATYTTGAVALDVSSQPIQFTNAVVIGF